MENKTRESNFELLRIVTMLFIVLHHFVIHGLQIAGYKNIYPESHTTNAGIFLNSFLLTVLFGDFSFLEVLKGSLRPFSHGNYWFVKDYFFLWLLSPILNWVITGFNGNKQKFVWLLIIFSVFQFYFGWFCHGQYSGSGYNLWNFMFLYFIGRFIALHTKENQILRVWSLGIYLFICIISAFLMIQKQIGNDWFVNRMYDYNSPLMIIAAVAFLLFFRSLNIKSKTINWLASSVLAVYLITESTVGWKYLYPYVNDMGKIVENGWLLAVCVFLLAVIIVISCLLVDKLRMLISQPIENLLCKIPVEKYVKLTVNKVAELIK